MQLINEFVRLVVLAGVLASGCCAAHAQGKPPGKDALLYVIWPQNGAQIKGAFWVRFGLRNMGITHAGDDFPNSGHHHLFVDVNEPLDLNAPIPQDRNHLDFGAGQTEARLELPPGKHTLQLVLGDAKHYPFNPPLVSKKITITILPSSPPGASETPAPPNEQPVEAQGTATPAASGTPAAHRAARQRRRDARRTLGRRHGDAARTEVVRGLPKQGASLSNSGLDGTKLEGESPAGLAASPCRGQPASLACQR